MNRRGMLSAFLGLPVAMKLGRWVRPAAYPSMGVAPIIVSRDMLAQAEALLRVAAGGVVYVAAGYTETWTLRPAGVTGPVSITGEGEGGSRAQFTWKQGGE